MRCSQFGSQQLVFGDRRSICREVGLREQNRFEGWLAQVSQRVLPNDRIERIRTFARELADGVLEEFWRSDPLNEHIRTNQSEGSVAAFIQDFRSFSKDEIISVRNENRRAQNILRYLGERWDFNCPTQDTMQATGYFKGVTLSQLAFELINETPLVTIFVSYKRSESSAFALLILSRLKAAGLEPFLDLALVPGENWHAGLKERIEKYDTFILILGKETLKSPYVLKEIGWAIEAGLEIIPIWHNGFEYKPTDWNLPPDLDHVLSNNHTIRVLEESALAYNNAIVELLNRFGVTP